MKPEDQEAEEYIRSFTRQRWFGAWCNMLKQNLSACAADTREGVRTPHAPAAARSGPPPSLERNTGSWAEDGGMHYGQRNDDGISASSAKTPSLLDDKLQKTGAWAKVWGGIATPSGRLPMNNRGIITTNSFNQTAGPAPSGREMIRRGENSSTGKLASPIDLSADKFGFLSRKPTETPASGISLSRAPPPRRNAKANETGSGRDIIFRSHDSSRRIGHLWSMPFSGRLFGSAPRDHRESESASPTSESPVSELKHDDGTKPQTYRDGTALDTTVRSVETPSRDELPPPPRYASFKYDVDPLKHHEERHRIESSLPSGGPEQTHRDCLADGQSDRQPLQPLPPSRDAEGFAPPLATDSRDLTDDPFAEYHFRQFSLRTRPVLGPPSCSLCSLRTPQPPDHHSLNSGASRVDTPDTLKSKGGTKAGMDAAAPLRVARHPIEIETTPRPNSMSFKHLPSATGSEGWTDSSRSHGTDDEGSHGPRAALRGITAVFKNSTEASLPRRNSFSSATWEPPPDEPGTGSDGLNESALEPKKTEVDHSLMSVNSMNWWAWDDRATINASSKHIPFAIDQPRRGSQHRVLREVSKSTAENSSWRSYRSSESNLLGGRKIGVRGDRETAETGRDGSRRDVVWGHKPGRGSGSVLAKIVGHNRAPVQSDVPRRRSVEISLRMNDGVAVVPITDEASGSGGDGSKGPAGDELKRDDARAFASVNADINDSVPERVGGGDPDLQNRTPVEAGPELNDVGWSPRAGLGMNSAAIDGGDIVQEEGATGRGSTNLADAVGVVSPERQGSRLKGPGVDGAEEGTSVFKGRGMALLTQYSNGFEGADDDLNGEDEGKVAAW